MIVRKAETPKNEKGPPKGSISNYRSGRDNDMIVGAAVPRFDTQQMVEHQGGLRVLQASRTEPLQECVRKALRHYLKSLAGHEVKDLHQMVLGEVERPLIETVLDHTRGNQTLAARLLGMSRSTLRKKMSHYGVGQ